VYKMRWARSSRKSAAVLAAFFFLLALTRAAFALDGSPQVLPLDPAPVTIATQSGEKSFQVEIADTGGERAIGMMHRKSMPRDQGMLFVFETSRMVTMWMKNTYVPLDIIFIDEKGAIAAIRADAAPLSLDIIGSGGEVRFALELNAGAAKANGMSVGDRVRHPVIDTVPKTE
jgi:uncharacterized protein